MKKKIELAMLLLLVAGLVLFNRRLEEQISSVKVSEGTDVVVVDAGHGGGDPGKVGIGDILEKEINLQIAEKVRSGLEKKKIRVVMTREEDRMLAEDRGDQNKAADMKARVACINGAQAGLAVSIHQNSYPDASVHGAQVFYYSDSEEGKAAAQIMQRALLAADPDNTRQEKANDSYYLLRRTEAPTIIVECGFLTNPEEAQNLSSDEYQEKIAQAVCSGVTEYLGRNL